MTGQPAHVFYLPATSRDMLTEAAATVGFGVGNCLVFTACGHWWRESQPDRMRRSSPRLCTRCKPDHPASVGASPQGFARVPVVYIPLEPES